jgi:hypothetical protein
MDSLSQQAADPTTPGEVLADLAYRHPELRPIIASNPATYAGLRDWLRALEDPAVDAALSAFAQVQAPPAMASTARSNTAETSTPNAPSRRRPWIPWLIAGAAGVVALTLVAVMLWPRPDEFPANNAADDPVLHEGSPTPSSPPPLSEPSPEPRDGSYPGVSTATLAQLPVAHRKVTADYGPEKAVQRFADDVAAGKVEALVGNCWTFAPATVRDRYGTEQARGAILEAFSRPGRYHQGGALWEGAEVLVNVRNEELTSPYACPDVTINGVPNELNYVDAEYLVSRLYGRLHGTPVRSSDTERNYPLLCDNYWELPAGVPQDPPVVADRAGVDAAIEALGGHELAVREIAGPFQDKYYSLTRLDGSSSAQIIVSLSGSRMCVGDGSRS